MMSVEDFWKQTEKMTVFAQKALADEKRSSNCLDFWTQFEELADTHICEHDELTWVNAFAYPLNADGSTNTSGAFVQLF